MLPKWINSEAWFKYLWAEVDAAAYARNSFDVLKDLYSEAGVSVPKKGEIVLVWSLRETGEEMRFRYFLMSASDFDD